MPLIGFSLSVIRAKNKNLEGIEGKIIFETKNVFYIRRRHKGRILIIPKKGNIFLIQNPQTGKKYIFSGDFLESRLNKLKKMHRRRYY